jgi:hypothetical protein
MSVTSENKKVKTEADEIMEERDHATEELCVKHKRNSESNKYRRSREMQRLTAKHINEI